MWRVGWRPMVSETGAGFREIPDSLTISGVERIGSILSSRPTRRTNTFRAQKRTGELIELDKDVEPFRNRLGCHRA